MSTGPWPNDPYLQITPSSASVNQVPYAGGNGQPIWLPPSLGLPSGGFQRLSFSAVASQSPTSGLRNPRLYIEADTTSVTGVKVYVYHDITPGPGDTATQGDVAYSVGTKLDFSDLVYQGIVISRSAVQTALSDASLIYVQCGGIVKDNLGTYHTWVCTTNSWTATMSKGYVLHFTGTSAAGPWAYADTALAPSGAEIAPLDNGTPAQATGALALKLGVSPGTWILVYQSYSGTYPNRQTRIATASSLSGPWTKQTGLNSTSSFPLNGSAGQDGPEAFIDDGRLWLMTTTDFGQNYLYDLVGVGGTVANPMGPILNWNGNENGNAAWGRGGVYRFGGDLYCVWQGRAGPTGNSTTQYQVFAAKWKQGKVIVPYNSAYFINGTAITNSAGTFTLPSALPYETTRVLIHWEVQETSTYTAGEYVYLGGTNFPAILRPHAANQYVGEQAWLDLQPTQVGAVSIQGSNTTVAKLYVTMVSYERLP